MVKIMKSFIFGIIMATAGCLNSQSPQAPSTAEEKTEQANSLQQEKRKRMPDSMTIAMTGDIMMGTTFPSIQLPANDGRDLFRDTKEITQQANIAVGNLEGAVCEGGQSTKGTGPNSFEIGRAHV